MLVEGAPPSPNVSPIIVQTPNVQSSSNEVDRLHFTLDVNPIQKGKYRSDKFNQRNPNKTNGYVCRIQGSKVDKKAKASVLPRIHVSHLHKGMNLSQIRNIEQLAYFSLKCQ
jgi:hypothetical protein